MMAFATSAPGGFKSVKRGNWNTKYPLRWEARMTNQTGHPPMSNAIEQKLIRMRETLRELNAARPAILELRNLAIRYRAENLRRGSALWTVALSEGTDMMDEEDYEDDAELILQRDPIAQWISGQCELAAQIDKTKDPEAKQILRDTMNGVKCLIDPPRGQLVEVKNDKAR